MTSPRSATAENKPIPEPPVRSKDRFLVFGAPAIGSDEIVEVLQTMQSGWLGTGPKVARFQKDMATYTGAQHAMALNSCTAALHLSLLALDLGPGDEVITTPLTFCATVNAIIHAGAVPVVADIDPTTLNIDPAKIEEAITPKTKAIVPVHFAGKACEMDSLLAIARKYDLAIIEDCAHAIETTYRGRHAGTIGDLGCFSFYVTKNVVTGEGGMVTTDNAAYAERISRLGLHGMSKDAWNRFGSDGFKHYQVVEAGFKYNMMDLQAAIGIHQLARVEKNLIVRQHIWSKYNTAFADMPITLPPGEDPGTRHARHLYTIQIQSDKAGLTRDEVLNEMTQQGIGVGVHYLSLPEHPYYKEQFGWDPAATPFATDAGRNILSLPISANLSEADTDDVIAALRRVLKC